MVPSIWSQLHLLVKSSISVVDGRAAAFWKTFIHLYTDFRHFLRLTPRVKKDLCSHTFLPSWETQSRFHVCSSVSMCAQSCRKLFPFVIWKKAVVTQDQWVSPLSLSLTQGCIIIIALCDSHTASLRANASWQLSLHEGPWATLDAGGLSRSLTLSLALLPPAIESSWAEASCATTGASAVNSGPDGVDCK